MDLQPAVAAEHGDAFVEMVDRLLLHGDQRVVVPLHRQLVGHILEGQRHAAEGMRRRHHAEGGLARRVDQVLERLDQGHHMADEFLLVGAEIRLLGDLAALALGLQHLVDGGLGAQEGGVEAELLAIGAVEEFDPAVGAEDHDAGAERLQHVVMGRDVAHQLGMALFERGLVEGEADHARPRPAPRGNRTAAGGPSPPAAGSRIAQGPPSARGVASALVAGLTSRARRDHLGRRQVEQIGEGVVAIGDRRARHRAARPDRAAGRARPPSRRPRPRRDAPARAPLRGCHARPRSRRAAGRRRESRCSFRLRPSVARLATRLKPVPSPSAASACLERRAVRLRRCSDQIARPCPAVRRGSCEPVAFKASSPAARHADWPTGAESCAGAGQGQRGFASSASARLRRALLKPQHEPQPRRPQANHDPEERVSADRRGIAVCAQRRPPMASSAAGAQAGAPESSLDCRFPSRPV